MEKKTRLAEKSMMYALRSHMITNHKYDGDKPYEVHLIMVVDIAKRWIHLIPEEYRDEVISACWTHDVIEDCRQTYNDVRQETNGYVAELVYACTNEKGRNRKERSNDKYYEGIRNTEYASFVKVCDRAANYQYSKQTGSRMADLYEKEMDDFIQKVGILDTPYSAIVNELKPEYLKHSK